MKQNKLKLKKNKHLNNGCFLLAKKYKNKMQPKALTMCNRLCIMKVQSKKGRDKNESI